MKFEPTLKSTDSPTRAARIKEEAAKSRMTEVPKLSLVAAEASRAASLLAGKVAMTDSSPMKDVTADSVGLGGAKVRQNLIFYIHNVEHMLKARHLSYSIALRLIVISKGLM